MVVTVPEFPATLDARTGPACVVDPDKRLTKGGDRRVDGRVEAAFASAMDGDARLEQAL